LHTSKLRLIHDGGGAGERVVDEVEAARLSMVIPSGCGLLVNVVDVQDVGMDEVSWCTRGLLLASSVVGRSSFLALDILVCAHTIRHNEVFLRFDISVEIAYNTKRLSIKSST